MGVVPFNVRTYGGKTKLAIPLEQKSLCTVSNIFLAYYLVSYVLALHSYLTVAPSVRKWSNTHTHGLTDKLTTVTRLRMRGEG